MNQTLRYHMTCGCELEKHELVSEVTYKMYDNKKRNVVTVLCCPEHPGHEIHARSILCQKCGAVRMFSAAGGQIPSHCVVCRDDVKIEKLQAWHKKHKLKVKTAADLKALLMVPKRDQYDHLRDNTRLYCKHKRDICLTTFSYFTSMPCGDCLYFVDDPMVAPELPVNPDNENDIDLYNNWESGNGVNSAT